MNTQNESNTQNDKNSGRDQFLEKVTMYKGFVIKYVAFMFHDDIIPAEHAAGHYHWLEMGLGIIVGFLLLMSFAKIVVSSAIELIGLCKKLRWHFSQFYYNRGTAYNKKGEFDRALQDFNKAIALDPEDAQSHQARDAVLNQIEREGSQ